MTAEKLGLDNQVHELKVGDSFSRGDSVAFHSIRYDFKPASVDTSQRSCVDVGQGHQVTVTVPHVEGSGTQQTVYKGNKRPLQKECVLIVDHTTGEFTLEKLASNIQLKKTRAREMVKLEEGRRQNEVSESTVDADSEDFLPDLHPVSHGYTNPCHKPGIQKQGGVKEVKPRVAVSAKNRFVLKPSLDFVSNRESSSDHKDIAVHTGGRRRGVKRARNTPFLKPFPKFETYQKSSADSKDIPVIASKDIRTDFTETESALSSSSTLSLADSGVYSCVSDIGLDSYADDCTLSEPTPSNIRKKSYKARRLSGVRKQRDSVLVDSDDDSDCVPVAYTPAVKGENDSKVYKPRRRIRVGTVNRVCDSESDSDEEATVKRPPAKSEEKTEVKQQPIRAGKHDNIPTECTPPKTEGNLVMYKPRRKIRVSKQRSLSEDTAQAPILDPHSSQLVNFAEKNKGDILQFIQSLQTGLDSRLNVSSRCAPGYIKAVDPELYGKLVIRTKLRQRELDSLLNYLLATFSSEFDTKDIFLRVQRLEDVSDYVVQKFMKRHSVKVPE